MQRRPSLYGPDDKSRHRFGHIHASQVYPEVSHSPFRADVANLVHSPAFRRLQGKTQLFPAHESDLFRTRLTHTLEVAQIARSIAAHLNRTEPFFQTARNSDSDMQIDLDVVEFAAYAHDIGHPPFGHTGEKALDALMLEAGGFEGNAQTLRTICRLIKRHHLRSGGNGYDRSPANLIKVEATSDGQSEVIDTRIGLNLTYRCLASALKYDREIPTLREPNSKLAKGYYSTERELVLRTKQAVFGDYLPSASEPFRTIECSIMDVADDIAYSTYDLEDAILAGLLHREDFLHPQDSLLEAVARGIGTSSEPKTVIRNALKSFALAATRFVEEGPRAHGDSRPPTTGSRRMEERIFNASNRLWTDGHLRTQFITWWVHNLVSKVKLENAHHECPALSSVRLEADEEQRVEILKSFTFHTITLSAPIQTQNFKGARIVEKVFLALEQNGERLMPPYERALLQRAIQATEQTQPGQGTAGRLDKRLICDYVAGMTDSFAAWLFEQLTTGAPSRTVNHQLFY
jgi:dGTPase